MDAHHAADDQQCCHDNYYHNYHYTTDLITDVWVHSLLKEVRKQVHISSRTVATELKKRLLEVGLSVQQKVLLHKIHCHNLSLSTHHLFSVVEDHIIQGDLDNPMPPEKL